MKKKRTRWVNQTLFLILCWVCLPFLTFAQVDTWDGTAAVWTNGSGTETNPYLIESAKHLAYLAQQVNTGTNYSGQYFKLTTDLDMDNRQWSPIGTSDTNSFQGHFDGDNHLIDQLIYNGSSLLNVGLFGYAKTATLKNIKVKANINASCSTDQVYVSAGGICGYAIGTTISYCSNSGTIAVSVDNAAVPRVGGICGYAQNGIISYCSNKGAITASTNLALISYAGGISAYGSNNTTSYCSNSGAVTAYAYMIPEAVGISSGFSYVKCCYNLGSISSTSSWSMDHVSGIGGDTILDCYNVGTLSGFSKYGCSQSIEVTNCYYLSTCGATLSGTSKTAEEMKALAFVNLLNANGIYFMPDATPNTNSGYPIFATLATDDATSVATTTATLNGHVIPPFTATTYGFKYKAASATDYTSVEVTSAGNNYTTTLTTLTPSTTYTYYFYAEKDGVTYRGAEMTFATCETFSGAGTESDPYLIASACHLRELARLVNAGNNYSGKHFKLTADIDLNNEQWTPIGISSANSFQGHFDGDNRLIDNLKYEGTSLQHVGLFGYVKEATLENIKVKADINASNSSNVYAGAICGYAFAASGNSLTIRRCIATGGTIALTSTASNLERVAAGGICGMVEANSATIEISDCFSNASVSSSVRPFVGGICGMAWPKNNGSISISKCVNAGSIGASSETDNTYTSGICGYTYISNGEFEITLSSNLGMVGSSTNGVDKKSFSSGIGYVANVSANTIVCNGCYNIGSFTADRTYGITSVNAT